MIVTFREMTFQQFVQQAIAAPVMAGHTCIAARTGTHAVCKKYVKNRRLGE
jgi:hypothetical protein